MSAEPTTQDATDFTHDLPTLLNNLCRAAYRSDDWVESAVKLAITEKFANLTERLRLSTDALAAAEREREAWQDFANHQIWCRTCGEDGVRQCDVGQALHEAANPSASSPEVPNHG
jgi:hypothetical protein